MSDRVECPFSIIIDTAEQLPYSFRGIRADANQKRRLFRVPIQRMSLGRGEYSLGDYSITGGIGIVHVERKSMEDAWGTLLGWPTGIERDRNLDGRRVRFEKELSNLTKIDSALIVVEATLGECLANMPQWGKKPAEENAKIFYRTVISYQQRFPTVQWAFCDSRRLAEITTFRWFWRYWNKNLK